MGSYSKIVKAKKNKGRIPEHVKAFVARRILDSLSGFYGLLALALLLSVISYSSADPSLNTASSAGSDAIHNWLGVPGAYLSDLFLQTVGLGCLCFVVCFAAWSYRIFRRQSLQPFGRRCAALIVAALGASIAFSVIPSGDYLAHPYLGSAAGTMLLDRVAGVIHPFVGQSSHMAVAGLAGVIAFASLLYACAVSRDDVIWFCKTVWAWTFFVAQQVTTTWLRFYDWLRHYGDPSYEPPARATPKVQKPKQVKAKPAKEKAASSVAAAPVDAVDAAGNGKAAAGKPERDIRVVSPEKMKTSSVSQVKMSFGDGTEWEFPPVELLQDVPPEVADEQLDEEALRKNAEMLQGVLADFNIDGEIVSIHPGPVVTLYELEPAPGTKTSRVIGLSDDIARSMSAVSVRCSVVPGRSVIGIELPNANRQTVYMREMLVSREVQKSKASLPLFLGKDIGGKPITADLAKMPHLLIAGTTGSGKSVGINTMILSILYRLPPEKCRFIMIDPKMLELSVYDDIPHLLSPVVTEPGKAIVALKWAVQEMENRYRAMSKLGVRNIEGYNARLAEARKKGETMMRKVQTGYDADTGKPVFEDQPMDMTELPYIVIIVDEFADLMLVAGKDVESAIQRLAQMARAAGIHMIMATQRPSVDVITGVIKANFPTRISFSVTSKVDSRTILGEGGAEQLLGMGDMLYMSSGGRLNRVHGPFVSDGEVEDVVNFLKSQAAPSYIDEVTDGGGADGGSDVMNALFGDGDDGSDQVDELYDKAVALVARERKASTSFVQRHMQIGYNRAARIIEEMEKQGVIGPANHVGKREVLVSDFSEA